MANQPSLPTAFQLYDTFGHWQYTLPVPPALPSAPTVNTAATIGTVVTVPSTTSAYILVAGTAAGYIWQEITAGGGAGPGNFTTLTATGATNLNNGTANDFNVLTGASAGNVHINDGTGTGTIALGNLGSGNITLTSGGQIELDAITNLIIGTTNSLQGTTNINASVNSNTSINTGTSTGTVSVGGVNTTNINIANAIPAGSRLVTISGGLIASAVNDVLSLGSGGVNFAGSTRTTSVGNGAVTIGTNTVNVASGAVGATGINAVNIANGAITAGGASTVAIGSASTGSSTIVTTPATTVANSGLGVKCGAAATINILADAGAPTNGVTLAPQGSLYINTTTGGVNSRMWIATAANTWTPFTNAA